MSISQLQRDSFPLSREQKKKGSKNYKNNPKSINKMAISTYLSIITLNVNGLNAPIKRQSVWMDTKTIPVYMLPTRDWLQI